MNDLIISGLIALLIGSVGTLSYMLGRKAEKNEDFEEKSKTLAYIRSLRCRLDDSDVVKRLHDTFKR